MIAVLDASVVLKWFFTSRSDENDIEYAMAVLRAVASDQLTLIQPPHFVAEVAAVLAREKPETATEELADLMQIEWQVRGETNDYEQAMQMASQLNHHLFDTLYHAVAINTPGAVFITADARYHRRASAHFGQSMLLKHFSAPA